MYSFYICYKFLNENVTLYWTLKKDFFTNGQQYYEEMINGMNKLYGNWLRENKLFYEFGIQLQKSYSNDEAIFLVPTICFKNETDATAFKLRWL